MSSDEMENNVPVTPLREDTGARQNVLAKIQAKADKMTPEELRTALDDKEGEILRLTDIHSNTVAKMRSEKTAKDKALDQLTTSKMRLNEMQKRVDKLATDIETRDDQIDKLNRSVTEKEGQIGAMEVELKKAKGEVVHLESEFTKASTSLKSVNDEHTLLKANYAKLESDFTLTLDKLNDAEKTVNELLDSQASTEPIEAEVEEVKISMSLIADYDKKLLNEYISQVDVCSDINSWMIAPSNDTEQLLNSCRNDSNFIEKIKQSKGVVIAIGRKEICSEGKSAATTFALLSEALKLMLNKTLLNIAIVLPAPTWKNFGQLAVFKRKIEEIHHDRVVVYDPQPKFEGKGQKSESVNLGDNKLTVEGIKTLITAIKEASNKVVKPDLVHVQNDVSMASPAVNQGACAPVANQGASTSALNQGACESAEPFVIHNLYEVQGDMVRYVTAGGNQKLKSVENRSNTRIRACSYATEGRAFEGLLIRGNRRGAIEAVAEIEKIMDVKRKTLSASKGQTKPPPGACKYFANGSCRQGSECRFRHELPQHHNKRSKFN